MGSLSASRKRGGEDEFDACVPHHDMCNMPERHELSITAGQFVWQPDGEDSQDLPHAGAPSGETNNEASTSGERRPPAGQVAEVDEMMGESQTTPGALEPIPRKKKKRESFRK